MSVCTRRASQAIGADFDWIEPVIRRARANPLFIRDADIRFVDSLGPRLQRHGCETFMSAKQREWVRDIAKRLDKAGVGKDGEEPGDAVARPVDEAIR